MVEQSRLRRAPRSVRMGAAGIVLGLHLLLLALLALQRGVVPQPPMPPIHITLAPLFAGGGGGGVPERAKETVVPPIALNRPPEPQPRPDSPPAPVEPPPLSAPAATLTTTAPSERVETSSAQGGGGSGAGPGAGAGDGGGTGSGSGDGTGGGLGRGTGHQLIQGPANAAVTENVSLSQMTAIADRYAVLSCRIGLDERLHGCRVLSEHPRGEGTGREALIRAREFRIRPPSRNGVYQDDHRVSIAFKLPPRTERNADRRR